MTGTLRLIIRAALSLACILLIIPLMGLTWLAGARHATRAVMQAAFTFGAWTWGVRVRTQGALARGRPLIIVSNHFTYLDLFVLGSKVPAAFTPKSEIRSWPVIGLMCAVSGCLFIDRRATKTLENKRMLTHALEQGDIISIFPEGTTNDGTEVLPFKSAFFSLASDNNIDVQPISVVYTKLDGAPLSAQSRPVIGWYGDTYFFPHLAQYLKHSSVEVELIFHPPAHPRNFPSRKELARYCQSVIEKPLAPMIESLRG